MSTRTVYAGGTMPRPTYHRLGDHMEAVEVVYDPSRLAYEELLAVFWRSHPAAVPEGPPRARTAVLVADDGQRAAAERSLRAVARRLGEAPTSRVLPLGAAWPAEPRHQKANLQLWRPQLVAALAPARGGRAAFLASTAAARLNALVGGFGDEETVRDAARSLGVAPEALRARLAARGTATASGAAEPTGAACALPPPRP